MRKIAVINQKGGVGKTTSCCNIGAMIAATGRRCLLIDLDPQAHLTMHLGFEPDADKASIYDVLTDNVPVADAMVEARDNLMLIPSHIDLAAAEMELVSVMGREVIMRDALKAIDDSFEFVMIDCPPSLGVLTINGLAAMNEVFVPMQPHFLALQGVGKMLETIRLVKERINPHLSLTGIILCMYEAGTRLAGEVSADLAGFLEESRGTDAPWANAKVFKTIIRRNIKLAECPSHGLSIEEYAPRSNGAADYAALTAEALGITPEEMADAIEARREAAAKAAATSTTSNAPTVDAAKTTASELQGEAAPSSETDQSRAREEADDNQGLEIAGDVAEPTSDELPSHCSQSSGTIDASPAEEAVASNEPDVYHAGDRVAVGPTDVTVQVVESREESLEVATESAELEVEVTAQVASRPAPSEASDIAKSQPTPPPDPEQPKAQPPAPSRRMIPVQFEEEAAESAAGASSSRD